MAKQYIEIFLFLDPLGRRCNSARKIIKQFRAERPEKIKLRVIPMVNFKRVYGHARKNRGQNRASIVERNNHFSRNTYNACLAFHASAMQGKNKAHEFLTLLQENVVEQHIDFSEALAFEVAEKIHLDMEMFEEDYHSELTKKVYRKNLKIASDMKIVGTPSCVIYKDGKHEESIRLGEEIEREILHSICGLEELQNVNRGEEIQEEVAEELENVFNLN
jgi:predicted DsbA family dithiol-disulfide isomerase